MKEGMSLQEFALELQKQNEMKQDYLVDSRSLQMEAFAGRPYLHLYDKGMEVVEPLEINQVAHRQIASHLKIPADYYDKMQEEQPELLARNVNTWLSQSSDKRMLRTLGGTARAFLSSRYKRIDNMDIATIAIPILSGINGVRIESCQLTDRRMYIKAVNPRLEAEVVPGDIVQAGVIISNSEVGQGSVSIQPLIYRLVCSNGMIVNEAQTKAKHIGRIVSSDENFQIYSEKTIQAEDKAFLLKVQDTVKAAVDETRFSRIVAHMQEAKKLPMNTADVPEVIRLASRQFNLTKEESAGVLQRLIESNDLNLYGLANAVTRYSQDVESYDRATDLEAAGYNILTMPVRQWNMINQMAVAA